MLPMSIPLRILKKTETMPNGIASAINTEGKEHTAKKRSRFEHNHLASPNASVM